MQCTADTSQQQHHHNNNNNNNNNNNPEPATPHLLTVGGADVNNDSLPATMKAPINTTTKATPNSMMTSAGVSSTGLSLWASCRAWSAIHDTTHHTHATRTRSNTNTRNAAAIASTVPDGGGVAWQHTQGSRGPTRTPAALLWPSVWLSPV